MTETRDDLFAEHVAGGTVRGIAERHQIPKSTVGRIIIEDGQKRIEAIERDLLVAQLMQDRGQEPLWPAIIVPAQVQADRMIALELFSWCVKRLRQRGWKIEVITANAPNGVVFMLTVPEEAP